MSADRASLILRFTGIHELNDSVEEFDQSLNTCESELALVSQFEAHVLCDNPSRVRLAGETLLARGLPRDLATKVMDRLTRIAPAFRALIPDVTYHRLDTSVPPGWNLTNPAIHPTSPDLRVFIRQVNYGITPTGWDAFDVAGIIRSVPFIADVGETLSVCGFRQIIDDSRLPHRQKFPVYGFEDCRPFEHGGTEYAVANMRELTESGIVQIVLLELDDQRVATAHVLSAEAEGHQKNWMPVIGADRLFFVQQCYPLRIRAFDPASGTTLQVRETATSPFLSWFRGGSPLIPFDSGFLAVIHEAIDRDDPSGRAYVHRFVYFNRDAVPTHCTDQFSFLKAGVEFAAGLRLEGNDLIVSFGFNDASGWLGRFPAQALREKLIPIEERTGGDLESLLGLQPASVPVQCALERKRSGIVSVSLAGDGSGEALAGALQSVIDQVDRCLVIDTGELGEASAVAYAIAGEKAVVRRLKWPNDFAKARNASLEFANETNAAWAMILDADERMHFGDVDLGCELDGIDDGIAVLSLKNNARTYAKPRFFRLPVSGEYVGPTHEYFDRRVGRQHELEGFVFSELDKTADQLRIKSERDIAILLRETVRDPILTRWHYYLGDAYHNIGQHPEAIAAFRECASLDGWDEERAWACYREAKCWLEMKRPDDALDAAARGVGIHPGIAELAWIAGYACWHLERDSAAIEWAHLAIVHGEFRGRNNRRRRIGFRFVPALYESPFDVLRYAFRRLGDLASADQAEADYQEALAARLALLGS